MIEKKKVNEYQDSDFLIPWLEINGAVGMGVAVESFVIKTGELWCILGGNRSGVDSFIQLLAGDRDRFRCESATIPQDLAVVSFSSQQQLFEEEVRKDESDHLGRIDPGRLANDFLGSHGDSDELVRLFHLEHVLDTGYKQLSSGESRKLLLLEALTNGSRHFLIQNPYDGLDSGSCDEFDKIVTSLSANGFQIVITLTSYARIPERCTHLAVMKEGRLVLHGPKDEMSGLLPESLNGNKWFDDQVIHLIKNIPEKQNTLVKLTNGRARYGERLVFSGLNLEITEGVHTLITGPNGTGKSTLLAIISGDHPDCYINDLHMFGIRRGSGESIWELKQNMGIVSPDLHRNHYIPGNALQVVISGFFDSIGLYRNYTSAQEQQARRWLQRLEMEDCAKSPFRQLTFGEQRLVLIARALIKVPKLLILDEPTQGLDDVYRQSLLDFLGHVAATGSSTILYVSHRQDEYRDFFIQHVNISDFNESV
jgi:molybdate transport system ATP-binding protein